MWKIKILLQFFLAKLPMGEKVNHLLQHLNHSHSEEIMQKRIIGITKSLTNLNKQFSLNGATIVEIGTGWIPICSVLLYLMGAKTCHTYDHVKHIRHKLTQKLIRNIESQLGKISEITSIPLTDLEKKISKLSSCSNLSEFFTNANIHYNAPGDASRTGLEDGSVDLVYSLAVFEHIPKKVIYDLTIESKRILKNTGVAYHSIGLSDHYSAFDKKVTKVNFLKYSNFLWSFFVQNKISYHNRLREKQFLSIFNECGAQVVWLQNKIDPNDIDVLRTMKINKAFRGMSHKELAVSHTQLILSFP